MAVLVRSVILVTTVLIYRNDMEMAKNYGLATMVKNHVVSSDVVLFNSYTEICSKAVVLELEVADHVHDTIIIV